MTFGLPVAVPKKMARWKFPDALQAGGGMGGRGREPTDVLPYAPPVPAGGDIV